MLINKGYINRREVVKKLAELNETESLVKMKRVLGKLEGKKSLKRKSIIMLGRQDNALEEYSRKLGKIITTGVKESEK